MHAYTGLGKDFLDKTNLRVSAPAYEKGSCATPASWSVGSTRASPARAATFWSLRRRTIPSRPRSARPTRRPSTRTCAASSAIPATASTCRAAWRGRGTGSARMPNSASAAARRCRDRPGRGAHAESATRDPADQRDLRSGDALLRGGLDPRQPQPAAGPARQHPARRLRCRPHDVRRRVAARPVARDVGVVPRAHVRAVGRREGGVSTAASSGKKPTSDLGGVVERVSCGSRLARRCGRSRRSKSESRHATYQTVVPPLAGRTQRRGSPPRLARRFLVTTCSRASTRPGPSASRALVRLRDPSRAQDRVACRGAAVPPTASAGSATPSTTTQLPSGGKHSVDVIRAALHEVRGIDPQSAARSGIGGVHRKRCCGVRRRRRASGALGRHQDALSISWNEENFDPPLHFLTGTRLPAPADQMESFGLVYALSVFTHLEHCVTCGSSKCAASSAAAVVAFFTIHDEHTVRAFAERGRPG